MINYKNLFLLSGRLLYFAALLSIYLLSLIFTTASPAGASGETIGQGPRTIVIDPGHGGNDAGITGPGGVSEKQAMLALAHSLRDQLAPFFTVRLTRTGDYGMEIKSRTSIANNSRADLFISLHAGGSARAGLDRWSVYHDQRKPLPINLMEKEQAPFAWNLVQQRHIHSSIELAGSIAKHLEKGAAGQPVDVMGAPLAVLSGANMPAVVIEIGYLTHPVTAAKLAQESYLTEVAGDIAMGVFDFFEK